MHAVRLTYTFFPLILGARSPGPCALVGIVAAMWQILPAPAPRAGPSGQWAVHAAARTRGAGEAEAWTPEGQAPLSPSVFFSVLPDILTFAFRAPSLYDQ